MKKIIPLIALILIVASCNKDSVPAPADSSSTDAGVNDADVSVAKDFIKIGSQKWMTKNLNVNHYRNGDKIPQVRGPKEWSTLTTGAWCWYNDDSANRHVYSKLYNWYAVNDPRGLAPEGWHVASEAEWDTLIAYLGVNAGGKLKETGTSHWQSPNTNANDKTGFTALPGGYRSAFDGEFIHNTLYGNWWSSTQTDSNPWHYYMSYNSGDITKINDMPMSGGFSVRCVKD